MSKAFNAIRLVGGVLLVFLAFGGTAFGQGFNNRLPEIDPASAVGALTLLGGGLFLLACRARRN